MAPSSTKGAVTRLLRNAAINVTVFQFSCSTFWTSRSPCGARPYRRVIVVDTLVSSMNTSLPGSSLFCRRCNALRAAATSGRSCSAARKLFFKGQLQMMQKPRDRRLSDRDLFLRQSIFEFGQRDVRLLRYQLPHQILVRRQREIFIAAEFGRVDAARLPVKLEEADDRADADPALLRGFRDRGPALDRLDHPPTQFLRIWLRHSCRPPPSRKLESYSRRYGNPRFSLSGKRSSCLLGGPSRPLPIRSAAALGRRRTHSGRTASARHREPARPSQTEGHQGSTSRKRGHDPLWRKFRSLCRAGRWALEQRACTSGAEWFRCGHTMPRYPGVLRCGECFRAARIASHHRARAARGPSHLIRALSAARRSVEVVRRLRLCTGSLTA